MACAKDGRLSVKLINNASFFGYRTRRSVGGKIYQEYFSLRKNGQHLSHSESRFVQQFAQRRDAELQRLQQQFKRNQLANRCFKPDGQVCGISLKEIDAKGGGTRPNYSVGIKSEISQKTVCTQFSILKHGSEVAWRKAVEFYARHKLIATDSELFEKLVKAEPQIEIA